MRAENPIRAAAVLLRMIIVLGCSSRRSHTNCIGVSIAGVNAAASSSHNLKIQQKQHHPHLHHPYRSKPLPSSFWMCRGGDNNRRRPPPPPPLSTTSSSAGSFHPPAQPPAQSEEDEYYNEDPRPRQHYYEDVDRSRQYEDDSYYQPQPQQQPNGDEYRDPRPINSRSGRSDGRIEPASSSSSSSSRTNNIRNTQRPPIHYEFPAMSQESSYDPDPANERSRRQRQHPSTSRQHPRHHHPETTTGAAAATRTYSARSDPVTYYWTRHRVRMILSAAFLGASLGTFVGHALGILALVRPLAYALATLCVAGLFQRTSVFGELIRCLALVLLRAFLSLAYIRKQYPTHITACFGGTRHPFPPLLDEDGSEDSSSQQPPFPRLYAMIASGTVGSFVLGTFPLLPTWLGALTGFAAGSLATTLPDARGDLARTVGMRGVALLRETARLNRELHVVPKTMRFTEAVWDRLLFLDKQHRLKDRFVRIVSWMYTKATSAIQQPENNNNEDGQQQPPDDGDAGDDYETRARRSPPRPRNYPKPDSDGRNRRPPPQKQVTKPMRRDDALERF